MWCREHLFCWPLYRACINQHPADRYCPSYKCSRPNQNRRGQDHPYSNGRHFSDTANRLTQCGPDATIHRGAHGHNEPTSHLDFTSIRTIHSNYLDRLLNGCLLTNPSLTSLLESVIGTCEQFAAQVERWGGDVLPALLFEGSLRPGEAGVGDMVKERGSTVAEIDKVLVPSLKVLSNVLKICRHCAICSNR